jgi:hypothetical protein
MRRRCVRDGCVARHGATWDACASLKGSREIATIPCRRDSVPAGFFALVQDTCEQVQAQVQVHIDAQREYARTFNFSNALLASRVRPPATGDHMDGSHVARLWPVWTLLWVRCTSAHNDLGPRESSATHRLRTLGSDGEPRGPKNTV